MITSSHQFRHPDDISVPSFLYHYYAYFIGKSTPGYVKYACIDINEAGYLEKLNNRLLKKKFDVFCLNERSNPKNYVEADKKEILNFLNDFFPFKSEFEK